MAENRLHIQHYYTTGSGVPKEDNVKLGEIAVGAGEKHEKLIIKNSAGDIVKFLPEGADASYAESGHTHTDYLDKNSTESQTVEGPIKFSNGIEVYDDNAGEKLVANFKLVGDTPIINVGEGGDYVLHTGNVRTGEGLEVDTMGDYTLSISEDYQEKINKGVTALESFNAFITGVTDADQTINTLKEIQDYITQDVKNFGDLTATVNDIQDDISNLEINQVTEATVSRWGFTKNTGTITEVKANNVSLGTSGSVNIPSATTAAYGVTKLSSATNSTDETTAATPKAVKSAYDLANGKYTKPSDGIPKNDLANDVQNLLNNATTANTGVTKLVTGDLKNKTYTNGEAAAAAHTHSQYIKTNGDTSLGENEGGINIDGYVIDIYQGADVGVIISDETDDEKAKLYSYGNYVEATADGVNIGGADSSAVFGSNSITIGTNETTISLGNSGFDIKVQEDGTNATHTLTFNDLGSLKVNGKSVLTEETYKGTVTGVKINGSTKNPLNGVVDLGTVITSVTTGDGLTQVNPNNGAISFGLILHDGHLTIDSESEGISLVAVNPQTKDVAINNGIVTSVKYDDYGRVTLIEKCTTISCGTF